MRSTELIVVTALIASLAACDAPSNPNASTQSRGGGSVEQASLGAKESPAAPAPDVEGSAGSSSLTSEIGADCDATDGSPICTIGDLATGDFYDVEILDDCGSGGFFAGVAAPKADLLDSLPVTGSKAAVNATVSGGQFLCVRATARAGQQPAYFYVSPLPPAEVDACRDQETCNRYGARPVLRGAMRTTGKCAVDHAGRINAQCFRGWISAGAVEPFSNGL